MAKIRADCFAVTISTGKLVHVRRPSSGQLPMWATSGGEFEADQLRRVGRDLALPIVWGLLDTGADIHYEDGSWRVH